MQTGRPLRLGGHDVLMDGERGVVFDLSPEEEALARWQQRDYLSIEREQAREWRRELSRISSVDQQTKFQGWFGEKRPSELGAVKSHVDHFIDGENPGRALRHGLSLLNVPTAAAADVLRRWNEVGQPPLRAFAPFFCHVYGIDLFFYLSRAADLISGRSTNMIDIAYLYYLPFCMVFTSNDKLHRDTVPLFLRKDQTFVWGQKLKDDLSALDIYYDKLPESVKAKGTHHFASRPPADRAFLTTRLWDDHLKEGWRNTATKAKSSGNDDFEPQIIAKIKRATDAAEKAPVRPDSSPEKVDFMITKHSVLRKKGKWTRYPKLLDSIKDDSDS